MVSMVCCQWIIAKSQIFTLRLGGFALEKRNKMKKKIKQQPSLAVIRAVARLKEHEYKKTSQSIVWDGKSITQYLSVTS